MKCVIFTFIIASLVGYSYQLTGANESYYVAGVVEFEPLPLTMNSAERTSQTFIKYQEIITSTEARLCDIIVFPEVTLNTDMDPVWVEYPHSHTQSLCDNATIPIDDLMKKLSCIAKSSQKYIVVNIKEQANCTLEAIELEDETPCSRDDLNIYNTNVVFDHRGFVISKYRKVNLYNEGSVKPSKHNEIATFTTEFGVTFGHFICFDILFYNPAVKLIREYGIRDIIFPTMWFSELPFLTAVQVQQGFSFAFDVNVLAAGANNPSAGSTGSGIFLGRQRPVATLMSGTPTTKLLVGNVMKKNGTAVKSFSSIPEMPIEQPTEIYMKDISTRNQPLEMVNLTLKVDFLNQYTNELITEGGTLENGILTYSKQLCHDGFCCNFDIEASVVTLPASWFSYTYRAMVFSGNRTFGGAANGDVTACAIVACTDNATVESCGKRFANFNQYLENTEFKRLVVSGNFHTTNHFLLMPTTLDTGILPYDPVSEVTYSESDSFLVGNDYLKNVTVSLPIAKRNVMTFGIYARGIESGSRLLQGSVWVATILALFVKFLN